MRQFQTSVLERRERLADGFTTQPLECAWASEAVFFLSIEASQAPGTRLSAFVQISPDGIRWIDEGSGAENLPVPGDSFLRVRHFGGWLRLRFAVSGPDPVTATIRLALKE